MIDDELFDNLPNDGWLTRPEAELLVEVANLTEGWILEVGCYYGRSTIVLASLGRVVYSVDPFVVFGEGMIGDDVQSAFEKNLADRDISNVILCRKRIEDWSPVRPIGFAYLDGDHDYQGTIGQISKAIECGAREMCIHDWAQVGGGLAVKRAIEDSPLELVRVIDRMAHCRLKEHDDVHDTNDL